MPDEREPLRELLSLPDVSVREAMERVDRLASLSPMFDGGRLSGVLQTSRLALATASNENLRSLTPAHLAHVLRAVSEAVLLVDTVERQAARWLAASEKSDKSSCMANCVQEYMKCKTEGPGRWAHCETLRGICEAKCLDWDESDVAFLYPHHNWNGDPVRLGVGIYEDLGVYNVDETITSVRVPPRLQLTLWNNKGRTAQRVVIRGDCANLSELDWNDIASSAQVEPNGA